MTVRSNRRLVALFLGTVLLPCAVLLAIALRTMQREREFNALRAAEDRLRGVSETRQALLAHLDRIREGDPTVRFVGELRDGALVHGRERKGHARPRSPRFETRMREGEVHEFTGRDPGAAAKAYAAAMASAGTPEETAEAQLAHARVLLVSGARRDAVTEYQKLLALPFSVTDEHGVPFSAYAASQLARSSSADVARHFDTQLHAACCVSAEGWFMVKGVVDSIRRVNPTAAILDTGSLALLAAGAHRRAEEEVQVAKLKSDFRNLGLARAVMRDGASWIQYGSRPWFVSTARRNGKGIETVLGVDAASTIATLNRISPAGDPPTVRLSLASASNTVDSIIALAPQFPGVLAAFQPIARSAPLNSMPFYLGMLLLVVGASLFGAYMVWYDVRRELRISELRSQFVASVSHELKTPLTSIRMFAETLLLGRSRNPEAETEYLANIVHETERLTRLLNNVLDVSTIDRGQKVYRLAETSLPDVIARCARTMEYPLAQHGLRLNVDSDISVPPVAADEDAIEQAILNLLTNAMKYSNGSREIDLRLNRLNGDAIVAVRDHGVGIPAECIARVTEKFYRVPSPENARIPGTGLGLTLVAHIAEGHGGRLHIASEPGKGSTVSIHLPLIGPA